MMSKCQPVEEKEDFFEDLIPSIQERFITPILGPGLLEFAGIPMREIMDDWCTSYPLTYEQNYYGELPRLAQHQAIMHGEISAKRSVIQKMQKTISCDREISPRPHQILARLNAPYYITTTVDTLLEQTIERKGKTPSVVLHPWKGKTQTVKTVSRFQPGTIGYYENGITALREFIEKEYSEDEKSEYVVAISSLQDQLRTVLSRIDTVGLSPDNEATKNSIVKKIINQAHAVGKDFTSLCENSSSPPSDPTPESPLVYKILGCMNKQDHIALLENHYFTYLTNLELQGKIDERVKVRLHDSSLLFLGFRMEDWTFRMIFQSLMRGHSKYSRGSHFIVHPCPDTGQQDNKFDEYQKYLRRYFNAAVGDEPLIYWGELGEFFNELENRLNVLNSMR